MASGVALHSYKPPEDSKKGSFLELLKGELVEDIRLLDGGWWYGSCSRDGEKSSGYFPSSYVSLHERNSSAKQGKYDGGAMQRSNSKSIAKQMTSGEYVAPQRRGSLARRSSINRLRMMAYGTTSDKVERENIDKSRPKKPSPPSDDISGALDKIPVRKSSINPLDYVNERITQGDVHRFVDDDDEVCAVSENTTGNTKSSLGNGTVFRLKDDATDRYFTFSNGIYSWEDEN